MKKLPSLCLAATLFTIGVTLCQWEYGTMFWGNWLHTGSFSFGLLAILATVGASIAAFTARLRYGAMAFSVLFALNLFLFDAFPGWLILHAIISSAVEGPMPRGM